MAIIEVLTKKTIKAARAHNVKWIIVAGGVSANSGLRALLYNECKKFGIQTAIPRVDLCTDNAAMIGFLAEKKLDIYGNGPYSTFQFTVNSSALRANHQFNKMQNI
jgi:N6-L-threonylcarbamoyladenine synthase